MGVINRKIDPNGRMLRQHPFDVWRALNALRSRDVLVGEEYRFFSPEDIARVLYVNFDDLLPMDRSRVLTYKLDCPLRFLANSCFVEEHKIFKPIEDRWSIDNDQIQVRQGTYRARDNVFNIKGWTREYMLEVTRDSLDKDWGRYIGRRGALIDWGGYSG